MSTCPHCGAQLGNHAADEPFDTGWITTVDLDPPGRVPDWVWVASAPTLFVVGVVLMVWLGR